MIKTDRKRRITGYVLAVMTIVIWSSTFIVSKILLLTFHPIQILLMRFVIALFVLTILYPKFKKGFVVKEEVWFLVTGICLALYFFFENSALSHTYSSNVSLIVATIPLLTGLLAIWIEKKPFFSKQHIFGFILAYTGVAAIIINGNGLKGVSLKGDLFALTAALMFSGYTLTMQKIQTKYHLIEMTRKVFLYSFITLLVLSFFQQNWWTPLTFQLDYWVAFLYLGVAASGLAFLMWNKAIESIGSVMTSQFIYLVPVVTTIFAVLFLGEALTLIKLLGGVCIIGGLYLSEKKPRHKKAYN